MKSAYSLLILLLTICVVRAASPSWAAFDTNTLIVIQDTNLPAGFIGVRASGGSQTPWLQNINGGGHSLSDVDEVQAAIFSGSGAALDNLNASALASGTISTSVLPTSVPTSVSLSTSGTVSGSASIAGNVLELILAGGAGGGGGGFPLSSNVNGAGFAITNTALTNEPVVVATNISSAVGGQFNGNGLGITNVSSQTLNWNGGTNSTGVISNGTQTAVNTLYVGSLTTNNGPVIALANITNGVLTASTALVSDPNKAIASSSTTATELGYVHGVTSGIQAQINALSGGGGSGFPLNSNVSGAGWGFTNVALTNEPIVIATNLTVQGIFTSNGSNFLIGTNTFISQPSSAGGALVLGLDGNNRVNTNAIMTNAYTPSGTGFFTPISATSVATTNNASGLTNMASQTLSWNGGTNMTGVISNGTQTAVNSLYVGGTQTNNGQTFFNAGVASYTPHTPVAVSVGASPFTFTYTGTAALECYFDGTVSAYSVTKNGAAVYGSLAGADYFILQPNSVCVITWAVNAPTFYTNSW